MKKSLIAILATAVMIVSFLAPVMLANKAYALSADPTSWYYTENGVLGTDSYLLYPYKSASMNIGFSKYGELIDNNTNVGLEYNNSRDPWAELPGATVDNSYLPKNVWINGWMLSVTYNNSLNGLTNVWAAAMFGDLVSYGGPWLNIKAPYSCTYEWQEDFRRSGFEINAAGVVTGTTLSNGGRKTNGTCITDPMKIIYNGPRKFIATLTTHVWDINQNAGTPLLALVDVMFTIEFSKVSKQVIVFKEVKAIPHPKFEISPLQVRDNRNESVSIPAGMLCQFSDREEWDLGTKTYGQTDPYSSYVHFYVGQQSLYTDYNNMFTVLPTLPSGVRIDVYGNSTDPEVNLYGSAPQSDGYFDVAQIISNDKKYAAWAAFWPQLSDWEADAGGGRRDLWYRPIAAADPHDTDAFNGQEPFLAPLTVGEWDFMLAQVHSEFEDGIVTDKQFRGIAVYGVSDVHDASDPNMVIDSEARYQMFSVFRPVDLKDAIYGNGLSGPVARWVDKYAADGDTYTFYLRYSDQFPDKTEQPGWPFVFYEDLYISEYWGGFQPHAERVLIDNKLQVRDTDYEIDYDGNDYAYIYFLGDAPADGSEVKILFSTWYADSSYYYDEQSFQYNGAWEWLAVGRDSAAIDSAGAAMVSTYVTWWTETELRNSALDMQDTRFGPDAASLLSAQRSTLLPDRTGYRDANIGFNLGRLGLKDDWSCHTNADNEVHTEMQGIPIASSSIITVGGPSANAVTEYTNDFTDAFATLGGWTGSGGTAGVIYSTSCWSKNTYVPEYDETGKQTVGYGVISAFKDPNGTVFLVLYGYTGQDTYYTCWSLMHSDVFHLAADTLPAGVTSIVLKFDYTLHATDYCFVTIMEALGTISEYDWQGFFLMDGETPPLQGPTAPDWPAYPIWVTDKYPAIHVDP
jgi:hypothetical protein